MYKQLNTFWKYSSQVIGVMASIIMLLIYAVQFIFINVNLTTTPDFYSILLTWLGIEKNNTEKSIIYDQMIPLFAILVICSLQKESLKCETLFVQHVTEESLNKEEEEYKKEENHTIFTHEVDYSEKQSVYEFEKPVRQCLTIRNYYLKLFFYMFGMILY